METNELYENFLGRKPIEDDFEITKSSGSFIYDAQGKKYIDFLMGWCVGNFGWDHIEIKQAIGLMESPNYVYPHLLYKPWARISPIIGIDHTGQFKEVFQDNGRDRSCRCGHANCLCATQNDINLCRLKGVITAIHLPPSA